MDRREKLPPLAAIVVNTSRAAVGIACGASLAMFGCTVAWQLGYPITRDGEVPRAALYVLIVSLGVWLACVAFAWIADRKRGL